MHGRYRDRPPVRRYRTATGSLRVLADAGAAVGEVAVSAVRAGLLRCLPPAIADSVDVVAGTLGSRAEILGAIALAGRSAPARLLTLGGRTG